MRNVLNQGIARDRQHRMRIETTLFSTLKWRMVNGLIENNGAMRDKFGSRTE
jgi:hypothetical protein